jgi:hypothetical protein
MDNPEAHFILNKVTEKFAVPILTYMAKYETVHPESKKHYFSYHAISIAVEKFSEFIDIKTIEY